MSEVSGYCDFPEHACALASELSRLKTENETLRKTIQQLLLRVVALDRPDLKNLARVPAKEEG